jgi:hypothetical protein
MTKILIAAIALAGCSSFDYTATVGWNTTVTPQVVSVTVADDAVSPGSTYTLERSYASWSDSEGDPIPVIVVTTSGTMSFQMVPSPCGDFCVTGGSDQPPCGDISAQTDQWLLIVGGFAVAPDLPALTFGPDEGSCTIDGKPHFWEARIGD